MNTEIIEISGMILKIVKDNRANCKECVLRFNCTDPIPPCRKQNNKHVHFEEV